MKIIVAKKLGFCYGVKRAMQIAEDLSKTGTDAVTLGPIIHNNQVVAGLRSKGIDY
ncbi:MAG: 4-hydroxy-3-methylbut-2-enyl diphosphate reductase, partial [Negativicoccus succinicivorans]|nr:4-hydroxy-3-methylbut-2-enyl diphosphate reductase [Negativicoccus succinicivorans]